MLTADFISILRCPKCQDVLTEKETPSGLHCANCHVLYLIEDGIPNLLLEDAKSD